MQMPIPIPKGRKDEYCSEAMVQRGEDKEARIVPQRTTHILRTAFDKGCAHLYGAAADVSLGHRHDKYLCRPPQ